MRQLKISQQVTNRESAALDKYLQDIAKINLLTPEAEVEITKKIKAGDKKALETLVNANLRFVVSVAKQYQYQGLSLIDLINEGNLGLIKAAQRFDETKGFKFISYAVWWIRQAILQSIAEHSRMIRLPINKIGIINKILKAYSILEQKLEREPDFEELSVELGMRVEEIEESLKFNKKYFSMDAPLVQDEEMTLHDVLESDFIPTPEALLIIESLKKDIERVVSVLSKKESEILRMYFGINVKHPMTLEEIGETFDLTRERVRQIKEKAVKRLRSNSRCKMLRAYV